MDNKTDRPGYWAVIPAEVRYDDALPPNAKLLYGELGALADDRGACRVTNGYFARLYQLSERTVRSLLATLEAGGYIRTTQEKDQKTGQNQPREIRLNMSARGARPGEENFLPPGKYFPEPRKISSTGTPEKGENPPIRNNINNNITSLKQEDNTLPVEEKEKRNIKEKRKTERPALTDEQIRQTWIDWIVAVGGDWSKGEKNAVFMALVNFYAKRETRKQDPSRTPTALTTLGNRLLRYGGTPDVMLDMLERATTAGWKSVFPLAGDDGQDSSDSTEVWL